MTERTPRTVQARRTLALGTVAMSLALPAAAAPISLEDAASADRRMEHLMLAQAEGEGEGAAPIEAEGEAGAHVEGEGEGAHAPEGEGQGEGAAHAEGEGEAGAHAEGEGEGALAAEGEGEGEGAAPAAAEGEGEGAAPAAGEGEGEGAPLIEGEGEGEGAAPAAGEGEGEGEAAPAAEGEGEGEAAAGGEGEGEGGEGGEGEGEGGGGDVGANVLLLRDLGFMTGHLRAGLALYEIGDVEAARTHMGHPIEEKYDAVADRLEEMGMGSLREDILALSAATEENAELLRVQELFDAVIAKVEEIRAEVPGGARAQILGLAKLAHVAADEYTVAVKGGEISNLHEYQDSWGFFETIRQEGAQFMQSDDPAVVAAAERMMASVYHVLNEAYGDIQGNGDMVMEPSILYGASARIELAGLGIEE